MMDKYDVLLIIDKIKKSIQNLIKNKNEYQSIKKRYYYAKRDWMYRYYYAMRMKKSSEYRKKHPLPKGFDRTGIHKVGVLK